ncbi:spatacsin-like isoform X2 [Lineus longissimus]|uniref:spatacsin-like isoform X2 n=1 Tax=Lineus longissimus TaxID=88925 RepID=UPI00315D6BDB
MDVAEEFVVFMQLEYLYFYHYPSGRRVAKFNTRPYLKEQDTNCVKLFSISPDLKTLCILTENGSLLYISFDTSSSGLTLGKSTRSRPGSVHTGSDLQGRSAITATGVWKSQVDNMLHLSRQKHRGISLSASDWKYDRRSRVSALQTKLGHSLSKSTLASSRQSEDSEAPVTKGDFFIADLKETVAGHDVNRMCCGNTYVSLLMRDLEEEIETLLVYEYTTDEMKKYRCTMSESRIIFSEASHPHLVLESTRLLAVSLSAEQEQIINKMMIHDSASLADQVCCLNSWDRCAIPVHTLEVGLKHRQLDTVAFFLKTRESAFSRTSNTELTSADPPWTDLDLLQLTSSITLLTTSIQENIHDHGSKQFAEQLLHITLNHLHKLLQSVTTLLPKDHQSQTRLEGEKFEAITSLVAKLSASILHLRKFLKHPHLDSTKFVTVEKVDRAKSEPGHQKVIVWKSSSPKDIVEDALLTNCLPIAQAFLWKHHGQEFASKDYFTSVGLCSVTKHLQQENLSKACKILANLGFVVNGKLKDICRHTSDKDLRSYLVSVLTSQSTWTQEESTMVDYLTEVEAVYGTESVSPQSFMEDPLNLKTILDESGVAPFIPLPEAGETIRPVPILLEWTRHWDKETVNRIILDKTLPFGDISQCQTVSKETVWKYLATYNRQNELMNWVRAAFPLTDEASSDPGWPYCLPVTMEMIDCLEECSEFVRENILDELARRGVFCNDELHDFNKMLRRLKQVQSIMKVDGPMKSKHSRVSIDDYHGNTIEYLVGNELIPALYLYLDFYGIDKDQVEHLLSSNNFNIPWVQMMLRFRDLARGSTDSSKMLAASSANAGLMTGMADVNVHEMIKQGLFIPALATLFYQPIDLRKILTDGIQHDMLGNLTSEDLKEACAGFPKLQAALFPSELSCGMIEQDITVYNLLQGNASFDPTHLYGWKQLNPGASEVVNLPHFADPEMQAKYSHHEVLQPSYYLTHGRPSFAFTTFISSLLENSSKTLGKKRISHASMKAHILAIKNFTKPVISSSCVAYIEMLGRDGTLLRVCLYAASAIYSYRLRGMTGTFEERKETERLHEQGTTDLLMSALRCRKKYFPVVLEELERATLYMIERDSLKQSSFEASLRWQPVLLLCRLSKLRYSTLYLQQCAKVDNWLQFMAFAQLHQYSSDQLFEILHLFPSTQLQEHLHYVISSANVSSRLSPQPSTKIDMRKSSSFIQRHSELVTKVLGVSKSKERDLTSEEEDTSSMSTPEPVESARTSPVIINREAVPDNLFAVLFICQATLVPWISLLKHSLVLKNPILAILAACFKECNLLDALTTWLICSADDETYESYIKGEKTSWTLSELQELITTLLHKRHVTSLAKGFSIFQKGSILVPLLMFCKFVCHRDFQNAKKCLIGFKECILQSKEMVHSTVLTPSSIGSLEWELSTSRLIILELLKTTTSTTDISWVLTALHDTSVILSLKIDQPDLHRLQSLYTIATECSISPQCGRLADPDTYEEECQSMISLLIDKERFDDARRFAVVAGIDTVNITMKQVERNLARVCGFTLWESEEGRIQFWNECSTTFTSNRVPPGIAAAFFQEQSSQQCSHIENVSLLQLAYDWLCRDEQSPGAVRDEVQMAIWKYKIQIEIEKQEKKSPTILQYDSVMQTHHIPIFEKSKKAERSELLIYGKMPRDVSDDGGSTVLTSHEILALDSLLGTMLDQGKISEACKMAAEFSHYSQDLAIILTCIRLAQQVVTPDNIDESMKKLSAGSKLTMFMRKRALSNVGIPRNPGQSLSTAFGTSSPVDQSLNNTDEDVTKHTIATMEKLLDHCCHGNQPCSRVITAFKIAQMLKHRRYEDVINEEEYALLKTILMCDHSDKFLLARDYIVTNRLSDVEVAGFLCDIITHSLAVITNQEPEVAKATSSSELVFNPLEDASVFTCFIKLCSDPSVLGNRLLEAAAAMSNDTVTTTQQQGALTMEVELLVRSHECHTIACNMEGIASVLRTARQLTSNLAQAEEFTLMIRLLTGIGRFNEMTYIFDLLKYHHQFELLFRKGMEKENKLKLAVLDYLKRFHPTDNDTYTMVSLHFTMYREIAQMLEENAVKLLDSLKNKPLDSSSDTQSKLKDIQQYFCDAAESYIKQECLRHAQHCIRQARLVSLQLHLISSGTTVLNLDSDGLTKFITNHGKFFEAFIVAEAYHRKSDWAAAVCQQVAINGDFTYLKDLKSFIHLTPNLLAEIVDRFKREANKPSQGNNNMKRILSYCRDIQMKYKLATSLGLTDVVMEMYKGDGSAYLNDTVSA